MSISKKENRLAELQQERTTLEKHLRELIHQAVIPLKQVLSVIDELNDVEESIEIVEASEDA